jgi:hypothetical protein
LKRKWLLAFETLGENSLPEMIYFAKAQINQRKELDLI